MPKPRKSLPSADVLKSLFRYDERTGNLERFNKRRGGKKLTSRARYRSVGIDGITFLAHRVIWKIMTNDEPDLIDHIDGDARNNAWSNLRSCDDAQNLWNGPIYKNNTSGFKGVSFDIQTKRWRAVIKVRGRAINLGRFTDIEEAAAVVRSARADLHREFARMG